MNKCLTHHGLFFLAGAAFWECVVHISLLFSGVLPMTYWGFTITYAYNMYVIIGAALMSAGFLWLANRCAHCKKSEGSC